MADIIQKRMAELLYYKIWNQKEFRLIPYVFTDDCVTRNLGTDATIIGNSVAKVEEFIKGWLTGFPGLQVTINKMASDQHTIFVWCTCQGRHLGRWNRIEPTGKSVKIDMMSIHTINSGKIAENKIYNKNKS